MEQFSNFTYIKQLDLESFGDKFNMSYRLKRLLEEEIKLTDYGDAIEQIAFSPIIGEVFSPDSKYNKAKKKLSLEFFMDPEHAASCTESEFFYAMLNAFLQAMEATKLPADFDFDAFKEDLEALQFEQLQQAA